MCVHAHVCLCESWHVQGQRGLMCPSWPGVEMQARATVNPLSEAYSRSRWLIEQQ